MLNLSVAALVLSARPRRAVHALVAALVGTNGIFGGYTALREAGALGGVPEHLVGIVLNAPIFAAFILLPFFFPRERFGPRGRRIALGAGVASVLVTWAVLPISVAVRGIEGTLNAEEDAVFGPLGWIPFSLGVTLGTFLLLGSYLAARSPALRTQVGLVLAAYGLKVSTHAFSNLEAMGYLNFWPYVPDAPPWPPEVRFYTSLVLMLAFFAVPLALAANRLGARRRGSEPRPLGEDLFVLLFFALGPLLTLAPVVGAVEYMILRPLLLAYGILHLELIPIDVERRRPLLAVTVLAAVGSVFLAAALSLGTLGLGPDASTGLGFLVTAVVGGVLAWPLLRIALAPMAVISAERSRELYRATVEEAIASGGGDTTSNQRVLKALRERLRISEREHAALEAEARAALGQGEGELGVGRSFLGRYRIQEALGAGGFARTYLARDERLGREVVLKIARWTRPEDTKRALREGRILATLSHPHIVAVHDIEEVAGEVVLVLEHVPGGSLAERLRGGQVPLPDALRVADDVLAGLEAAHARGIVHRDVKPSNILLTADGRAKLADFGIAAAGTGAGTVSGTSFTKAGAGTLRYMAPEQARGLEAEARSDLYAVGMVLYEMLAGRPYLELEGLAEFEVRRAILEEEPRLPLRGVPRGLDDALRRVLAKDPAERPASAAELRRILAAAASVPP